MNQPHPGPPHRVLFFGVTGSGKSTAAHAYAAARGLPEYSADDDVGWLPGWQQRDVEEQRELVAAIAAREHWVLDSAYAGWRDIILARAELIIALDYGRWFSLGRLVRRTLRRSLTGQKICNGNTESLGKIFAADSIIAWHFQSYRRKRRAIREMSSDPAMPPVIVFRRPRELEEWLRGVRVD